MITKNIFKNVKEALRAMKSGWHSGKGFKSLRHNNYHKAIEHLEIALEYSNNAIEPVIYDNMSMAYYGLSQETKAMKLAEKSIRQYLLTDEIDERINRRIKCLQGMIITIKNNNK